MCALHTTGPVIRSVLQVKCIRHKSAKYEINKRKLSDMACVGCLCCSPEERAAHFIAYSIFLITVTHWSCKKKNEHNPDFKTCMSYKNLKSNWTFFVLLLIFPLWIQPDVCRAVPFFFSFYKRVSYRNCKQPHY